MSTNPRALPASRVSWVGVLVVEGLLAAACAAQNPPLQPFPPFLEPADDSFQVPAIQPPVRAERVWYDAHLQAFEVEELGNPDRPRLAAPVQPGAAPQPFAVPQRVVRSADGERLAHVVEEGGADPIYRLELLEIPTTTDRIDDLPDAWENRFPLTLPVGEAPVLLARDMNVVVQVDARPHLLEASRMFVSSPPIAESDFAPGFAFAQRDVAGFRSAFVAPGGERMFVRTRVPWDYWDARPRWRAHASEDWLSVFDPGTFDAVSVPELSVKLRGNVHFLVESGGFASVLRERVEFYDLQDDCAGFGPAEVSTKPRAVVKTASYAVHASRLDQDPCIFQDQLFVVERRRIRVLRYAPTATTVEDRFVPVFDQPVPPRWEARSAAAHRTAAGQWRLAIGLRLRMPPEVAIGVARELAVQVWSFPPDVHPVSGLPVPLWSVRGMKSADLTATSPRVVWSQLDDTPQVLAHARDTLWVVQP